MGIARSEIAEIIRNKRFDIDITWITSNKLWESYADPFILKTKLGYEIFYEKYADRGVGDIWLMKIDTAFQIQSNKPIFEDPVHASFPFLHKENGKVHMIPETADESKIFHFEYDPVSSEVIHKGFIMDRPVLDPAILKHDDNYWLFGSIRDHNKESQFESWVFVANSFEGPYHPHPMCPLSVGLDGIRAAGDFIKLNGDIYRPTQNCKNKYGESITINKITHLSKSEVKEDYYMKIEVNKSMKQKGVNRIHTLNFADGVIVIDGVQSVFSIAKPFRIFRNWVARKLLLWSILFYNHVDIKEVQLIETI